MRPQIRPGIQRLARLVTGRTDRAQRDADEQIALHLALRTEQLIAEGLSPEAARTEAERRFGSLDTARRELHASAARRDQVLRLRERFDDVKRDLRIALRGLRRTPGFAITVILCLALGVGANTASFTLLDELLLRPLPVNDPGSLVNFTTLGHRDGSDTCNRTGDCDEVFSHPMFRDLAGRQTSFTAIAAHRMAFANFALGDRSTFGFMTMVSGSYFPMLGIKPALGRLITPDDDRVAGEHPVAVLSHAYWTSRFGADSSIVGKRVVVNGFSLTVVGVAPAHFEGTTLGARPLLFAPLMMAERIAPDVGSSNGLTDRRRYWLYLFARSRPGVSAERAQAELTAIYRSVLTDVEAPLQMAMSDSTLARFRMGAIRLSDGSHGQSRLQHEMRASLLLLFAITAIVLVIACANIANLLLARAASRTTEMAVRLSLGASRRRLLAQLLTESTLLAVIGGAASLIVAYGMLEVIRAIIPPSGGVSSGATLALSLRPSTLVFVLALSIGTVLVFGLFPALHGTRSSLIASLRGGNQPGAARGADRLRGSLVTAQIALSMTLLISAGLFVKSLRNIGRVDLGMRAEGLVTFGLAPSLSGYDPARTATLFGRIEDALAALPGVTSIAGSQIPLLTDNTNGADVSVEGFDRGPDTDANSRVNEVGPGFFRTMGIPLLAGRELTTNDRLGAPRVAIVNEAFARKFGLGRNPVGKRMSVDEDGATTGLDIEIVGLAKDAKYSSAKGDMPPVFYTAYRQDPTLSFGVFYVRSERPEQVLRAIPAAIAALDPSLPVVSLATMMHQVAENTFMDRIVATASAAFAALATLLAAVGLYGVLAYTVAERRREFGLRMALGATHGRVRGMVLSQVGRMVMIGGAIGIAGAIALGRTLHTLLFQLQGNDPVVITLAVVVIASVALAAGYVPAWRASRVDPMQALRSD